MQFGNGYTLNRDDVLGSGAYGKVYRCRDKDGNLRAAKQVQPTSHQASKPKQDAKAHDLGYLLKDFVIGVVVKTTQYSLMLC